MSAEKRARVVEILRQHEEEMEGYAYYSSNRGVPKDEYEEIAEEIVPALTHQWQDISTAPRDGTRILCVTRGRVGIRYWNYQRFHANPRPFWDDDNPRWGISYCRQNPPTHWLPLPAPPEGD